MSISRLRKINDIRLRIGLIKLKRRTRMENLPLSFSTSTIKKKRIRNCMKNLKTTQFINFKSTLRSSPKRPCVQEPKVDYQKHPRYCSKSTIRWVTHCIRLKSNILSGQRTPQLLEVSHHQEDLKVLSQALLVQETTI